MSLYVTSTRGKSRVRIATKGKYVSTSVNDLELDLTGQPLIQFTTTKQFWQAVLTIATTNVNALP
jgi:hypothetical protein